MAHKLLAPVTHRPSWLASSATPSAAPKASASGGRAGRGAVLDRRTRRVERLRWTPHGRLDRSQAAGWSPGWGARASSSAEEAFREEDEEKVRSPPPRLLLGRLCTVCERTPPALDVGSGSPKRARMGGRERATVDTPELAGAPRRATRSSARPRRGASERWHTSHLGARPGHAGALFEARGRDQRFEARCEGASRGGYTGEGRGMARYTRPPQI